MAGRLGNDKLAEKDVTIGTKMDVSCRFGIAKLAINGLMKNAGFSAKDITKLAVNGANARRQSEIASALGFGKEQIVGGPFGTVGDTGTALAPMLLVDAISKSKPGDKILLGNYSNGADALLFEVQSNVAVTPSLQDYINSKVTVKDYKRYLNWRGLVQMVTGRRRPPLPSIAVTCLWREREQNLALIGGKCKHCGTIQFPAQRICVKCHTPDQSEPIRLSDKGGKLATFTEDFATPNPNPPGVFSVVDFEGGGRMWAYLTDRGGKTLSIGMPVEMTFRKLFANEGVNNYYWKSMPVRFPKEETH